MWGRETIEFKKRKKEKTFAVKASAKLEYQLDQLSRERGVHSSRDRGPSAPRAMSHWLLVSVDAPQTLSKSISKNTSKEDLVL